MSSPKTSTTHTPPVSYVELFYDLVMVATVIVFSSKVSHDLSAHNIVWFILVFAMLWWAWLSTTLVLNTARQNDVIVQFLIAIEMLGITLMTILVSDHVGSDRLTVSPTFGAIIFIVALLNEWLRVRGPVDARGIAARRRNAFVVSAVLWAAAGFLPAPLHGIAWIFAALAMVVPILSQRFSRGVTVPPIDEEHIVERFALLTLLVIGECFVKVALTATSKGIHEINLLVLPIEIGLIFAIWVIYFTNVVPRGLPSTARSRRSWMGFHFVLQVGLVGLAIGLGRLITLLDISTSKREDAYSLAIPLAIVFVALGLLILTGWGRAGRPMALVLMGGALASLALGILVIEIQPFTINQGAIVFGVVEIGAAAWVAWLGRTTHADLDSSSA